jgi:hypothetical protein
LIFITEIPLSRPSQILFSKSWNKESTVLLIRPLDLSILFTYLRLESKKINPWPTVPKTKELSFNWRDEKIEKLLLKSK